MAIYFDESTHGGPIRVPMIVSLMRFNLRVYEQGIIPENPSLLQIKNALFFNMVYLSNTDEMFTKYRKKITDRVQHTHHCCCNDIKKRVSTARSLLKELYNIDTNTDDIASLIDIIDSHLPVKNEEEQVYYPTHPIDVMRHDQLVEYPLDSFDDYLSFLNSAANNKDVIEIDLCLYRIGKDPAILNIIQKAVERGVQVHVNIELCASGEDINYEWYKRFHDIGCFVSAYGYKQIKVHCKLTLVKFINGKSVAQIGTGNYHTKTTTQYTDLSLVTADDSICHQVENVFSILQGKTAPHDMPFNNKLLVTRYNARRKLVKLIRSQANADGYICFKCNALDDDEIIYELWKAANKGCVIDLIVRGVCTWIPDTFTNVTVTSIVWDKLEHSRVYCFGNINPTVYIGSLDLVTHKLDRRIETLVKILNPDILLQVTNYLNRYITSSIGYEMNAYGLYARKGIHNGLQTSNDYMEES